MSWVLVLVCDENYFGKYIGTVIQIRSRGEWTDDIVCLPSVALAEMTEFRKLNQQLDITCEMRPLLDINEDKRAHGKSFQFHKYHVFDTLFKKWDYVFYLDVGMEIIGNLNRFKKLSYEKDKIYAHSDSFPTHQMKLPAQFWNKIDCVPNDYFQTTMFIYHTSLTDENTVKELVELTNKLPPSATNDQGVIAYYYCITNPKWIWIPLQDEHGMLYDYLPRVGRQTQDYVMLKLPNCRG
jgi:hypothetical protein